MRCGVVIYLTFFVKCPDVFDVVSYIYLTESRDLRDDVFSFSLSFSFLSTLELNLKWLLKGKRLLVKHSWYCFTMSIWDYSRMSLNQRVNPPFD